MRINKLIFYTTLEIIALAIMLITTYFIWDSFGISESAEIAYSYTEESEKLTLEIKNELSPLYPIKDNYALKEDNMILLDIKNVSKIKKRYNLFITLDETTTLDTKYLKLSLGENAQYLYNLENFDKNGITYYLVKTDEINSKEKINLNLYLWLSEETPSGEQNKELNINFKLEEM